MFSGFLKRHRHLAALVPRRHEILSDLGEYVSSLSFK
jgi:hypothetical protein